MLAFPAADQIEALLTAARPFLIAPLAALVVTLVTIRLRDRAAARRQAAANLAATSCKHGRLKRRNCHDCAVEFEAEVLAERARELRYGEGDDGDITLSAGGQGGGGAAGGLVFLGETTATTGGMFSREKAARFEEIKGLGAFAMAGARGTKRFSGPTKVLADRCAQTVRFSECEMLSGSSVRALHVALAGCSIEDVSRIRVRAAGVSVIDVTPAQLWTFLRAAKLSATPTHFTIPLSFGSAQGAPPDRQLALELDFTSAARAGTAQLAYSVDPSTPVREFLTLRSETLGAPASSNQFNYVLRAMGVITALVIDNLDGLDALRIYDDRNNSIVADFRSAAELRDWCEWITGSSDERSAWLALPEGMHARELRLEISTNAKWSAVNSFGILNIVPVSY